MSEVRCETCRFWVGSGSEGYTSEYGVDGVCRQAAPVAEIHVGSYVAPLKWPKTGSLQWCGQWRPGSRDDIAKEQ